MHLPGYCWGRSLKGTCVLFGVGDVAGCSCKWRCPCSGADGGGAAVHFRVWAGWRAGIQW